MVMMPMSVLVCMFMLVTVVLPMRMFMVLMSLLVAIMLVLMVVMVVVMMLMAMIIMAMLVSVLMCVVCAQLALLGVMLCIVSMAVCCIVVLHGSCGCHCTPVLALSVEVSHQGLSLPAEDLIQVHISLLTSKDLHVQGGNASFCTACA